MKKYSRLCAEIDLDAIDHNLAFMRGRLSGGTKICAVIKADGYGHGAVPIARHLEEKDFIWGYACATPEEAMILRHAGIRKPIILLGYAFPESYEDILDYDIRAAVFDLPAARGLSAKAETAGHTAKIHLAVDTGMGRIGFPCTESAADEACKIASLPGVSIEGLFTHFARADEPSLECTKAQLRKFLNFSEMLAERGLEIPIRHAGNSAAAIRFPASHLDMVRAGITIYGLMPSDDVASEMRALLPAMRLVSHISYVKTLPEGCPVSYGGTYVTSRETRVATVPAGYADGYPRQLSGRGHVLIRGKKVPVIGRVCMDQFMVDVSSVPDAKRGDEVVLIGRSGSESITAEEIGRLSGRFNYELVSCITKRVPRRYLLNGTPVGQVDYFD